MQSGTPDGRGPPSWLQKIAEWIDTHPYGVVTCSALKRSYRELIVGERKNVRLVYLQAERQLLEGRMGRRKGHFMPASLLDSQLATLEEPGADEGAVVVRVDDGPVEQTVDEIV
ncbi:gluconokinase-like, partial [Paramacrobiotus metropolitanus]|uniref:gluconokinase-like n=1 Tax=Paramacrobiotus metropolitanus TaxID=2943436 RepID=UPI00244621DD